VAYARSRETNLKQASFRPGQEKSWNYEYKTPTIRDKMPSGYNKGEEMHHLVPAELFGALVQNLSKQEAEIVINRANELGIRVGNDPANFIGLDKLTEHIRNDSYKNTVHRKLDDIGLESSELSGADREQFLGLQEKFANAPLEARLKALPDFVTYIAEPSIEKGREFRPQAQGIAQNKKQYQQEILDERNRELQDHERELQESYRETGAESMGLSQKYNAKDLNSLITGIRMMDEML